MKPRGRLRNIVVYSLILVLAIVAALFGTSNGRIFGVTAVDRAAPTASATPANPVDAQPAPTLFKATDVIPISPLLTRQYARAASSIDNFYRGQPTGGPVDDGAFSRWAARQVSAPPFPGAQAAERALRADMSRSTKRDLAAGWLRLHGCRDVWTSYVLEQQRFQAAGDQVADRSELDAVLGLAARIATAAHERFAVEGEPPTAEPCAPRAPAPAACGCSFPSSAAAMSAAARTYLAALEPRESRQYAWMERQVDLAQVYLGRELPSDVEAGGYIGYLVGRYFLASRGYPDPPAPPTTTAA